MRQGRHQDRVACNRYKLRSESARVAPEKRLHPGPPADHFDPGTTREVAMDADSEPETEGVGDEFANDKHFFLCTRVRDMREELGRRIQRMSAKSALTIADRLRLAYYEKTLRFFEPLPPETRVHTGFGMAGHSSRHPKEVREINQILDYLIPEGEIKSNLLDALPVSARLSSKKGRPGRPVTQRPAALRALQLQIDTGHFWPAITPQVCGCGKKRHDERCTENIRQSVNGLKRFLLQLGIQLPPKAKHQGSRKPLRFVTP